MMKMGFHLRDYILAPCEVERPFVFGAHEPVYESGLESALNLRLLPSVETSTRGRMTFLRTPLAERAERNQDGNGVSAVCGTGCA
jgi:hypothetical protein